MAPTRKQGKTDSEMIGDSNEEDFENEGKEDGEVDEPCTSKRRSGNKDDEFTLDEVLRLGGTKADYVMLLSVNDSLELVDGGKKGTIDDLKEGELEQFINKLGVRAYHHLQVLGDESGEQEAENSTKKVNKTQPAANEKTELKKTKLKKKQPESAEGKKAAKKPKDENRTEVLSKRDKINAAILDFQPRKTLLIKPGGKWFELEYTNDSDFSAQDVSLVSQYKSLAQKLFEVETVLFKTKKNSQKGASSSWMKTVVSTGTLADRMAAITLMIQDAPVHNLQLVEHLVSLIKKRASRRQSLMALDTLRELLLSDLLPENRKLRTFSQHPFSKLEEMASGNRDARDRRLILWYFEHQLKHHVAEFVVSLDTLAHDTVADTKAKALATAHELLCSRPEQEKALLVQVVNKLGDPEYKMATKASYLLEVLLHNHSSMKAVVCAEVERLIFRANINVRAQYYGVCFLNQIVLSHEEADLASKLITIYFSFFRACVKNKDVESKMLSALLSGVNRAYPYASSGDEKIREQMDTLFRVVHLVKFNTAVQALMLLFQVMDSQQAVSDRYYVALYRKLLDPSLSKCSRQAMFLNLLYKSMKADIVLRRVKAFVKRLLQVSCQQNPSFACGALFLVSEVMKAKPGLRLLLQAEEGAEEETFKDIFNDEEDDDGDAEEKFTDADKVEEGRSDKQETPKEVSSWVHYKNLKGGKTMETYDPLHRNPLYCGADHTSLWELQKLCTHFHPSVALFAKTITQGDFIQYTGDPLQDFTLIRFLDRFVFRNPKRKIRENVDSTVMQAKQNLSMSNNRLCAVNSKEFLAKAESQIPVEEVFFYRFFKKRETQRPQRKRRDDDEGSVEDVDDDEFEKALDVFEGDSYFVKMDDDDLDFAGNVKGKQKNKKKKDDDSDSDLEEDLDDEEVSLGSMDEEDFGDELEDEGGTFMDVEDEDEEEYADSRDDVNEMTETSAATKKGKRKKLQKLEDLDFAGSLGKESGPKRKKGRRKEEDVLPSAEEFGCLLDENAGSKIDSIGIDAMANRDKASLKQLKWEAQRDAWLHDRDMKTMRRKKAAFQKRNQFGKMRNKPRKKQ